jgi:hypothetical protein
MFIQVISGTVTDVDAMEALHERWLTELRPGATGFLGVTLGTTDDNRFVALARFASPEDARRNSDRPEQGDWWAEMQKVTDGVTVHDCSQVETLFGGGKDDAGFVQVMQGRVKDRAQADTLFAGAAQAEELLSKVRPDLIGEVIALHDDGDGYTDVAYFSSEAEARANEQAPMPDDAQAMMKEFEAVFEVDEYLDLRRLHLR